MKDDAGSWCVYAEACLSTVACLSKGGRCVDRCKQNSPKTCASIHTVGSGRCLASSRRNGESVMFVLRRHLDFINLMSYDFHGKWEKKTGINSPLFPHSAEKGNDRFLNLVSDQRRGLIDRIATKKIRSALICLTPTNKLLYHYLNYSVRHRDHWRYIMHCGIPNYTKLALLLIA